MEEEVKDGGTRGFLKTAASGHNSPGSWLGLAEHEDIRHALTHARVNSERLTREM